MSEGELKYKIFLFRALRIKKMLIIDTNKNIPKRDALFFTFLNALDTFI